MRVQKIKLHAIAVITMLLSLAFSTRAQEKYSKREMVLVRAGIYKPLYKTDSDSVKKMNSFYMDKYPVTNGDFLRFVEKNLKWRKSKVKKLFAEKNYLSSWKEDLDLGNELNADAPVTNISWFAAKEYCECEGKRLPTTAEWEYAAQASAGKANGSTDPNYLNKIISWYSKPTPEKLPPVGSTERNYWGIYDLHGLVWEWTSDFFSSLVTGESRGDSSLERNLFCGSGSSGSSDFKNYPAFMRLAFRSSLKANFTVANLGFRCVKEIK